MTDTVRSSTEISNPAEAADVTGASPWPDVVSVGFNAGGATSDLAIFTFSEPVQTPTAASFTVYNAAGTETLGTGTPTLSVDGRSVSVPIANGFAATAVGGSAADGAVAASTGTQPRLNRRDEAPGSPLSPTTITSGRTNAPDLVAVNLVPIQDAFGQTVGYRGIFTFDQAFTADGIDTGDAPSSGPVPRRRLAARVQRHNRRRDADRRSDAAHGPADSCHLLVLDDQRRSGPQRWSNDSRYADAGSDR